ncbi:hypothetical protein [Flavisphingomonas formosensis]|uniref:hypothetical protein n=1 Tax=Flavisphingomonas formosensis TaxID=861534 RepID=UPI0012FC861D|nr:hypothetical protein [Sphingomonas formosensis]
MTGLRICLAAALALGAAACSKPAADNAASADVTAGNVVTVPESGPVNAMVSAPAEEAGGADQGDLGAYVGHYPFDKVGGVSFIENPKVKAAIARTVTDKAILRWVTDPDAGPSDTIYRKDGKIAAWSCQQHNCGDHNWTLLVDPDGAKAALCYHDAEKSGGGSLWYPAGGGEPEKRDGDCPASKPSM